MFDYNIEKSDDIVIFKILGNFTFERKDIIYKEFDKYLKQNIRKFIFDLSETEYMDSSGVGTILMGASFVNRYGEKIKVVGDSQVIENFKCLKVDKYIGFFKSVDDAIDSFKKPI
jgi:anti-anti-sigma factor